MDGVYDQRPATGRRNMAIRLRLRAGLRVAYHVPKPMKAARDYSHDSAQDPQKIEEVNDSWPARQ